MKWVKAEDLQEGDTIEINMKKTKTASLTKIEVNKDGVWTEWSDGLKIELPRDQEFYVLD